MFLKNIFIYILLSQNFTFTYEINTLAIQVFGKKKCFSKLYTFILILIINLKRRILKMTKVGYFLLYLQWKNRRKYLPTYNLIIHH